MSPPFIGDEEEEDLVDYYSYHLILNRFKSRLASLSIVSSYSTLESGAGKSIRYVASIVGSYISFSYGFNKKLGSLIVFERKEQDSHELREDVMYYADGCLHHYFDFYYRGKHNNKYREFTLIHMAEREYDKWERIKYAKRFLSLLCVKEETKLSNEYVNIIKNNRGLSR